MIVWEPPWFQVSPSLPWSFWFFALPFSLAHSPSPFLSLRQPPPLHTTPPRFRSTVTGRREGASEGSASRGLNRDHSQTLNHSQQGRNTSFHWGISSWVGKEKENPPFYIQTAVFCSVISLLLAPGQMWSNQWMHVSLCVCVCARYVIQGV